MKTSIVLFLFISMSFNIFSQNSNKIEGCYVYRNPCTPDIVDKYKFFNNHYFIKKYKGVLSRYSYIGKWEIINDTIYLRKIPNDSIGSLPKGYENYENNVIFHDSICVVHNNYLLFFNETLYKKRTFFRSLISCVYFIYPKWEMKRDCKRLEKYFNVKPNDCECQDMFF